MNKLYRAGTCALVVFIMMTAFAPSVTFAAANDTSDGCPQSSTMSTTADGKQQCVDNTGSVVPGVSTNSMSDSQCYFGITGAHFSFNGCIWIPLMSWLGSWFLTIGGAFLRLAGTLFDMLIQHVIIDFKSTLDSLHITDAIAVGWTVFRDFSNILIIGIFVFIAISTILGIKEFGAKKLLANVLVVAVLMNFSLLFTKIIIDGSNFVAYQIYKQMAGTGTAVNFDIAQSFLTPMGITSVWDSTALVTKQVGQTTNSGLQAFLFGLVGGILLLAVAGVLFYGCFLIMSRAILFIFLMLTAAGAFATYLLPSLAKGEFGWDAWWKTLINNAIFAPLLMLLLAISLSIVNQAGKLTTVPLGKIIVDPAQQLTGSGWTAILIYIIGIGLLFVSFKMASGFANTIGGFGFASMLASSPFGLGSRLLAPALRNTLGRRNAIKSLSMDDRISDLKTRASQAPTERQRLSLTKDLAHALHEKSKYDAGAKRTYDLMNTRPGQAFGKAIGLPAALTKETKTNFGDSAKAIADHAAKEAASASVSKEDAKASLLDNEHKARNEGLQLQRQGNAAIVQTLKEAANQTKQAGQLEAKHREAQAAIRDAQSQKEIATQSREAGRMPADRHNQIIEEQDARIQSARATVTEMQNRMNTIDAPVRDAEAKLAETDKAITQFNKAIDSKAADMANTGTSNARAVAEQLAHGRWSNVIPRMLGESPENDYTAKLARGITKKKIKAKGVKARQEADREILTDAGEAPAAGGEAQH